MVVAVAGPIGKNGRNMHEVVGTALDFPVAFNASELYLEQPVDDKAK